MKLLLVAAFLLSTPAFAEESPKPLSLSQQLSYAKIQIGQLYVVEGNMEIERDKLQAEIDKLKAQLEAKDKADVPRNHP